METNRLVHRYNRNYYKRNSEKLRAASREYYRKNAEQQKENRREYRMSNREKILARAKEWLKNNRARHRSNSIAARRKKNGFSKKLFAARFSAQAGCCAICSVTLGNGLTSIAASADHDHLTHLPRGILCKRCNLLLGHAKDDPALLRRAADYLELYMFKRTA